MKIISTAADKAVFIETTEGDFIRFGADIWVVRLGESLEPVYEPFYLEDLYQDFTHNNKMT